MYDIIVIGGGPAGLSAAIYAKRAMLSVLVIEKDYMGTGQIAVTDRVENYPGLYGINGFDLGEKFHSHAEALGAEFAEGEVSKIESKDSHWQAVLKDGKTIEGKAIIYAGGTSYRHLEVPGGDKQRISYCAVCDGAFYRGRTVAVIGGGDTALGDAVYLSKIAEKVLLVHRRDEFRANKALQKQVSEADNIELITNAVLTEITGEKNADGFIFKQNGELKKREADGIFCAIGSIPNTEPLKGICELDERGYIIADETGVTSAKGIFAAGDVRTTPLRQVVTAVADGANAATSAEKYIGLM
ncbi:MAG: NAD(P)/FAD-dependent oxidoreductase [Oscillospiraceae bacterium]